MTESIQIKNVAILHSVLCDVEIIPHSVRNASLGRKMHVCPTCIPSGMQPKQYPNQ